jgi:NAD(P)-dependent dehydrogenase (short-subunit alcohol dehydrogenase family)
MSSTNSPIDGIAAVTGAGQGLGLGITRAFTRRAIDVLALVLEPEQAAIAEAAGDGQPGSVRTEVVDVTAPGDFAFDDDLEILVNNAGVRRKYHSVEYSDEDEWRVTFEVNFFGLIEMTRRAIPVLRERGSGVICNVSSGALLGVSPFQGAYRASKAAVSSICETLRLELAPFGIRIVEIMPGPTASQMNLDSLLHRIADAAETEPYRPMAEAQRTLMDVVPPAISIDEAGEVIVDAIFDSGGPMRYGTEPLSFGLLDTWRSTTDEDRMTRMHGIFEELMNP